MVFLIYKANSRT